MNLNGWTQKDRDGTSWERGVNGHYLSLSLEPQGWVGSLDSAEKGDTQPESGPGEYGAKRNASRMQADAQKQDPPDPSIQAFYREAM